MKERDSFPSTLSFESVYRKTNIILVGSMTCVYEIIIIIQCFCFELCYMETRYKCDL